MDPDGSCDVVIRPLPAPVPSSCFRGGLVCVFPKPGELVPAAAGLEGEQQAADGGGEGDGPASGRGPRGQQGTVSSGLTQALGNTGS